MTKIRVHLTIEGTIETVEEKPRFSLPLDEHLPMELKLARTAKDLTLRELAELSGVSVSHIGRIERGERIPTTRILRKLECALAETKSE